MPDDDARPDVIPSPVDPRYECVRADRQDPSGGLARPPQPADETPADGDDGARRLCPEGYVPRVRRTTDYELRGKSVVSKDPPERNPRPPEDAGSGEGAAR